MQAMAIKTETEYYRQWRKKVNENGEGFTMGALYWQLNDVRVAPSWSGIGICNTVFFCCVSNHFISILITNGKCYIIMLRISLLPLL